MLTAAFGLFAVFAITASARASVIDDIPDTMNSWLFDGSNEYAAGMLLSCMVLASVGLGMAVAKLNQMATLIILLTVMGALCAIGWLDYAIFVTALVVVAALFTLKVTGKDPATGG